MNRILGRIWNRLQNVFHALRRQRERRQLIARIQRVLDESSDGFKEIELITATLDLLCARLERAELNNDEAAARELVAQIVPLQEARNGLMRKQIEFQEALTDFRRKLGEILHPDEPEPEIHNG
jgi:hypothetical protein